MPLNHRSTLDWISSEENTMIEMLKSWVDINSWSENLEGLASFSNTLISAYKVLGAETEHLLLPSRRIIDSQGNILEKPLGEALRFTKHPDAPIRIFLSGHMDTVYSNDHPFQKAQRIDQKHLVGPGTADMKGGLIVLLKAVEALERSALAGIIGWEILINPDEELGSPGSEFLFLEAAKRNQMALIFEPSFPDGSLVTARKGSANFTVVAKGKSAHAGRDFHLGRNAITLLMRFIMEAEKINDPTMGITVNIGHIEGGGPVNIIPDLAICRLNVRMMHDNDLEHIKKRLEEIIDNENTQEKTLFLYEQTARPPKLFDEKNQILFNRIEKVAMSLGMQIKGQPSGGVCDGNIMSAAGVPTIDTLGVVGGNIHTQDEYMLVSSLVERTSLTAALLLQIAEENL